MRVIVLRYEADVAVGKPFSWDRGNLSVAKIISIGFFAS
jgi:hypothetical protein